MSGDPRNGERVWKSREGVEGAMMELRDTGFEEEGAWNKTEDKEIDKAVEDFSKDERLGDTDSVFVPIMSHGDLGIINGVKCTEKDPDVFHIDKIFTHLNTKNCPALCDKPKVIIIQACRGAGHGSVLVSDCAGGGAASQPSLNPPTDEGGIEGDAYKNKEKDFISFLSSTPNEMSYRHKTKGAFLIQYIVEIFTDFAHKDHIMELFTKVISKFEEFDHGKIRQIPTINRCSLTKPFHLFPSH